MSECSCDDKTYHEIGCQQWKPVVMCHPSWEMAARAEFGDFVRYLIVDQLPIAFTVPGNSAGTFIENSDG